VQEVSNSNFYHLKMDS